LTIINLATSTGLQRQVPAHQSLIMDKAEALAIGRRALLGAIGTTGVAAALAAGSFAAADETARPATDDKSAARYRETEEVKTFYRVNRYPG